MGRVVVLAALPGRWRQLLEGAGHTVVAPAEGLLDAATLAAALPGTDGLLSLLTLRIDDALLARAPALRVVGNYAVGYDNVDVAACVRRGVTVTNTPVLSKSTADLTLALVLGAARRVREGLATVLAERWGGFQPEGLLGLELDGARLGLVGLGRIGAEVARRARAFGMEVIYASPTPKPALEAELGVRRVELDALFAESDVVSIHCPLTPETRHLVDARRLAAMKPGAILVNTARGPVVDEAALVEALARGPLGAVGLDVFEHEPRVPAALRDHPRALVLPHIGSATWAARTRMAETAAQSIVDVLAGRAPRYPVT